MAQNRIALISAGAGALAVLVVSVWLFTSQLDTRQPKGPAGRGGAAAGAAPAPGQPLPAHHLANLNKQEIPADELRRGRVLLVYLTTSCDPCIKEVEVVSRLHAAAPPELRIYGVAIERPAQVETFIKEFDLKFPVLLDLGPELARSLEIHHFPSKYLVEDGIITKTWRGVTQDEAELRRELGMK